MTDKVLNSFYDVTGIQLSQNSLLKLFNIVKSWDDTYFLNIWKSYSISDKVVNNSSVFEIYIVEDNDWWENISYKLYGTKTFWWLLCLFNNIENPFEELEAGKKLKVLNAEYLYQFIKEIKYISKL